MNANRSQPSEGNRNVMFFYVAIDQQLIKPYRKPSWKNIGTYAYNYKTSVNLSLTSLKIFFEIIKEANN